MTAPDVQVIDIATPTASTAVYVPGSSGADLGPVTARVTTLETSDAEQDTRLSSLELGGGGDVPGLAYRHTQSSPAALVQIVHGLSFAPAGVLCTDTLGQLTEPDRITHPLLGVVEVLFGAPFTGDIAVS